MTLVRSAVLGLASGAAAFAAFLVVVRVPALEPLEAWGWLVVTPIAAALASLTGGTIERDMGLYWAGAAILCLGTGLLVGLVRGLRSHGEARGAA